MRNSILLAAILLLAFCGAAFAQTGAGAIWIGGEGFYSSAGGDFYTGGDDDVGRTTMVELNPIFVYFVVPHLFLGPATTLRYNAKDKERDTFMALGPEIGWAFGSKGAIPYVDASFVFGLENEKTPNLTGGTDEKKTTGSVICFGGGVVFRVSKHVGVDIEAEYQIENIKPEHAKKALDGNIFLVGFGVVGMLF